MASEKHLTGPPKRGPFKRRRQLEQDLEHITQEMYRRNKELVDTNRTLSLLRTVDNLVLDAHYSLVELSSRIVTAVTDLTDYEFIALLGQHSLLSNKLEVYGWSVNKQLQVDGDITIPPKLGIHTNTPWFKSAKKTKLLHIKNFASERAARIFGCTTEEVAAFHQKIPLSSLFLIKLTIRQKLVGVLVVGSTHLVSTEAEINSDLLERLGEAIGVALDNKMLFEENQRVALQLRKSNAKLKALDEAKDEFISMASHQLRTPLTAVKGYLSMVLDGDTGPVKKNQKELTQHAFDGAQRMVYLIADLLNVSRMQTGKFVIENQPTYLPEVVEGEVAQLKEQITNREITLTYHKPEHFPTLNLDETKVRQVIMNFLDNALYYTPKGGKVDAALQATNDSVTFTVTDNGVGVPKAIQHHLFSKFYRADNARKMRPDGTGLGLYMAKKVIVAQGGTIIFKSEEGKGSIFGFSFPRKSMEVKGEKAVTSKPSEDSPKQAT